jgi:hypothetical protein
MVVPRVGTIVVPRVGTLLKKVPKRRKRPKMAKLPVGNPKKQGKATSPEQLPEWVVKATRLPLKRERSPRYPNGMGIPDMSFGGAFKRLARGYERFSGSTYLLGSLP